MQKQFRMEDLLEELKSKPGEGYEEVQATQRDKLLKATHMGVDVREPGNPKVEGVASQSNPSFLIGQAQGFRGVQELGAVSPETGHLSKEAFQSVVDNWKRAGESPNAAGRDAETAKAAQTVAKSVPDTRSAAHMLADEVRGQVVFATRELAEAAGLNKVQAAVVGYSFERALEKEGFKVLAHHAIEKAAAGLDYFRGSSSAAAVATGQRAQMDKVLDKSLAWLADRGVSKEGLQGMVKHHTGKLQLIATAAQHPEELRQIGRTLAKSESALDAVMAVRKDSELRNALGTVTMAAGESIGMLSKGVGSAAIVAGAALKSDSSEEMGRHIFRAGMAILGGAAGGIGGGATTLGVGSVAGAVVGQHMGSVLADKILEAYDRHLGRDPAAQQEKLVSQSELNASTQVLADRAKDAAKEELSPAKVVAAVSAMERGR